MKRHLEADLRSIYPGVRLLDFYEGKLSLRELIVLATELPEDSRVARAINEKEYGERARWPEEMFLYMDIANSLRESTFIAATALWAKGEENKRGPRPQAPEMLHPPGWEPEIPEMSDNETLSVFFGFI